MSNAQHYEAILAQTLADGRLSRSEREALSQVLDEAKPHEFALVRSHAFALASDALEPSRARKTLEWCKDVVNLVAARETARLSQGGGDTRAAAAFSPGEDCLRHIVDLLRDAHRSVDVCVFTITDNRIRRALVDAHERRVQVRIVTDDLKSADRGSDIELLAECGIPVRIDRSEKHMHHKFAVFDGSVVLTGSYNWTRSAAEHNEENIVVTGDPRMVEAFRGEFEALWKRFG